MYSDYAIQEVLMQGFGVVMFVIYFGLAIFMLTLAVRFVNAWEKIANSISQIAEKFGNK
jgi:hypothetical protein